MKNILTLLLLLVSTSVFAQTGILKGKIIHEDTKLPYFEVSVMLKTVKMITTTNGLGDYEFSNIPYGTYEMIMSADGVTEEMVNVTVSNPVNEMDIIALKSIISTDPNTVNDNPTSTAEDASSEDMGSISSAGQNVSSVLNASRDAYLSAATFGWGQFFYRIRGYENDQNTVYLNGVPLNDLEEGGVFFNSWSGLNDVFRGRTMSLGLAPGEYTFGSLGLNTTLDASASNQRKGTRVTYTATNRSYRNRLMLTHSSGLQKNGWAYSVSLSRRWANEGQIKGTFYDAYGYFGAIEKHFKKQSLGLMVVGAPIKRGKNGPATDEAFDLAGSHYYNPYWGYQNGKIRNSRVLKTHSPLFILSHEAELSPMTSLTSAVSYQIGETAQTGIDWQNTADPRPDYYRYLPSYRETAIDQAEVSDAIKADPNILQVQWDKLYEANRNNQAAGYSNSVYVLNSSVETSKRLNLAVNMKSEISEHVTLHSGISYQKQNNHNFQRVEDLLGGQYYENINQFAARTFGGLIQNADRLNILETDTKKKEGDTYGYDYNIQFSKAAWFAQTTFVYNKVDFFLSGELGYSNFYRVGNFQSGLYTTNSYGKSASNTFFTPKAKGGVTYKINGRNYLYANGSIGSRAPFVDNIIISPRTRNEIVGNPQTEKFTSAEVGYLLRAPNVKGRVTLFATDVKNATDIKRFYRDDDYSFVSMAMQGINKRYTGIEAGAEIKLSPSFTVNLAGALTQSFYTSRPYIDIYSDNEIGKLNTTASGGRDTVYMKNYYVPSGPQSSFQAALRYNSKRYWYGTLSFNYLANNYIDFAPTARTKEGVDNLTEGSEQWHHILDQKKLPDFYTVDLFMGKSFKVNKYIKKVGNQTFLLFNLGISNLLNNTDIKLYGFENLRFDKEKPDLYDPKSAYTLGIQYFLNLSLRF